VGSDAKTERIATEPAWAGRGRWMVVGSMQQATKKPLKVCFAALLVFLSQTKMKEFCYWKSIITYNYQQHLRTLVHNYHYLSPVEESKSQWH
jgi:hypothetical protein